MNFKSVFLAVLTLIGGLAPAVCSAQELIMNTVVRPPFAMRTESGVDTGFTIELMQELARRLDFGLQIHWVDSFTEMLQGVQNGSADLAAANISITAVRETVMDFSHPIFESGLKIMVRAEDIAEPSLLRALLSWDLAAAILAAFVLLFFGGMLMWVFERRAQPYFDRPLKDAWFPSFWWALNLVVNGGFEERVPRSPLGRLFGVLLVVSSLFIVSLFVAKITAAMTVEAITGSVQTVNDLYGKRVGTIENSTAAGFLDRREIRYVAYGDLEDLIADFEAGVTRIVVFDAPILDHYAEKRGLGLGVTLGNSFLAESYGIALPEDSPIVEEINQVLLEMKEDGSYDQLYQDWFGIKN